MNVPENRPETAVSSQTTKAPGGFLQRAVWTFGLGAIASVLAIHAALAYSPELTRFVPEVLIKSPSTAAATSCAGAVGASCHARPINPADFAACCSMQSLEFPCLTDGIYHEGDAEYAETPADALSCPNMESESAQPIATDAVEET